MMRPARVGSNVSVAYVELAPDGSVKLGLRERSTLESLRPLAVRTLQAAHELEVSAVREQLGVAGGPDAIDVVCVPVVDGHHGIVVRIGAPTAARQARPHRSGPSPARKPGPSSVSAPSALVIPFPLPAQRRAADSTASVADTMRVELTFAGRWPAEVSIQANGALDARTKLRAADALRDLSARLLDHEARHCREPLV